MLVIDVELHPKLEARAFITRFPEMLGSLVSSPFLPLLKLDAVTQFEGREATYARVRDMLRVGGYKPTGRGKPASEYLLRAASEGSLSAINVAVDACNVVSLHSGVPISVVDKDRLRLPLSLRVAPHASSYVFNASGQAIDLSGLLCLFDAEGPCANAVKDSQRTKTHEGTTATLSVLWGSRETGPLTGRAEAWYRELLGRAGAAIEDVEIQTRPAS